MRQKIKILASNTSTVFCSHFFIRQDSLSLRKKNARKSLWLSRFWYLSRFNHYRKLRSVRKK